MNTPPLCPRCNVPTQFYDGCLGYESFQCPRCHWDVNDPPPGSWRLDVAPSMVPAFAALYDLMEGQTVVGQVKLYGEDKDRARNAALLQAAPALLAFALNARQYLDLKLQGFRQDYPEEHCIVQTCLGMIASCDAAIAAAERRTA